VAVETHAGFETEGIAGGETGQAGLAVVCEEKLGDLRGEVGCSGGWDRNLEAVFAGVTRARDEERVGSGSAVGESEVQLAAVAKVEGAQVGLGGGSIGCVDERLEDGGGERALQRDQRAVFEDIPLDAVGTVLGAIGFNLGSQVLQVLGAAAGVGHEVEQVSGAAGDDTVVDDSTGAFFQEAGEGGGVWSQLID
jgi:hypothetical protein